MLRHKRAIKLIKPGLQLKLVTIFLSLSLACILLQFTLLNVSLGEMAMQLPSGGPAFASKVFSVLWKHLFLTVCLLTPLTLFIGILVTFRIAGPVYRFEQYLRAVAQGEEPGQCRIRKGDEFGELCDLINDAMLAVKNSRPTRTETEETKEDATVPAG